MVKVDVLPFAGNPARESTCGMLVLELGGLSGGQILGWGLGLSLLGMIAGLSLSETAPEALNGKRRSLQNGLRAAGVLTLLALLTALMGWWLPAVVFWAVTILLLTVLGRMATI